MTWMDLFTGLLMWVVLIGLLACAIAALADVLDWLDERREAEVEREERRQALRSWCWREVSRHDDRSVW